MKHHPVIFSRVELGLMETRLMPPTLPVPPPDFQSCSQAEFRSRSPDKAPSHLKNGLEVLSQAVPHFPVSAVYGGVSNGDNWWKTHNPREDEMLQRRQIWKVCNSFNYGFSYPFSVGLRTVSSCISRASMPALSLFLPTQLSESTYGLFYILKKSDSFGKKSQM